MSSWLRLALECNATKSERNLPVTASFTLVALDQNDRPALVPELEQVSEEEQVRYQAACERRDARLTHRVKD